MPLEFTDPDDSKLVTLARANRARVHSTSGAAVRDTDGRTYSAVDVNLPSLQLTALQVAVAMASSSGARGLEAALVLTDAVGIDAADLATVGDFAGAGVPIYRADASGSVVESVTT